MALSLAAKVAKDGGGTAITGGVAFNDQSAGAGTGPFDQVAVIIDSTQNEILGTTADAAVSAGTAGSIAAKLRAISRDLVANIVLAAGSALIGIVKIGDGTNTASIGTYGTAPGAVEALNVNANITNANGNGAALQANSAPVTQAPTSFRIAVTPTVTASAYTAGNVLGGILTFASALLGTPNSSPTKWSAVLESIAVKFKATAVTGEIDVAIFTASPSGGTYTDKTAPTFNAADAAKLVGVYALPTPESTLGTMTCYNLDGIGAVIDGASTSLFAVVTVKGTPTPASTSDVIVELGVLQG